MAPRGRWVPALALIAVLAAVSACRGGPRNPLIGSWELDADQTGAGVAAFVRQMGDEKITFAPEHVRIGGTELPVRYEVEKDRVRVIRTDVQSEDPVDLLGDGTIRIHFPAGYAAVYRRAEGGGSG